jgi:Fe-S-cluster containining protein
LRGDVSTESVWYKEGLRFSCEQCGTCCRGAGYVWLDLPTIAAIAEYLKLSPEDFTRKYVRRVGTRLSLIEKPNYDCIVWDEQKGCIIYEVRPLQCRTFPFWHENLESPDAWRGVSRRCRGVGKGDAYSVQQIHRIRDGEAEASASALSPA